MKDILERELARAEAVVYQSQHGKKRLHGPTVHNFEGQRLAYKRVLALLAMEEIAPRGPIEVHKQITITIPVAVLAIIAAGGILLLL